jgi:glucose/arabinose dehydrogenase
MNAQKCSNLTPHLTCPFLAALFGLASMLNAQSTPSLVDQNLGVRTVVENLSQPTSMVFLGPNNFLVLEKATGKVQHVVGGALAPSLQFVTPSGATLQNLPVNNASERGLLGIALDPNFAGNHLVYLYWTESSTGAVSSNLAEVGNPDSPFPPGTPTPLGNRVDRFVFNAANNTLTFDQNLITLRALQDDVTNGVQRGNHDGGVIQFGPDGKLYIMFGDNGRRGQMQNLPDGPGCTTLPCPAIPAGNMPDDQFGGPEPDNAHLSGVILRLNDDGSAPSDNPFFTAGAKRIARATSDLDREVGANLKKVFAYGIRNSFGMAFDPQSGNLWDEQNGDDSFSELNRVERGSNLGWVQIMGPVSRLAQFKAIETDTTTIDPVTGTGYFGLQQVRWSPTNIADTPEEALARLFQVFEEGKEFAATHEGGQENPPVVTGAGARSEFKVNDDGTLHFKLTATAAIQKATQAHIHLGARGQNGPVVVFLLPFNPAGVDFGAGDVIAEGNISDANIIPRPGFVPTVANLLERMRQGRSYANVHTVANPGGEIRGQIVVTDEQPVSHYSDPEFSWKFEVAPAGIGFMSSGALGPRYQGDLFTGAARTFLEGGQLFHFNLTGNRGKIAVDDPRLEDRVADNNNKFDITESESLLFGRNFGIVTDIETGPNGNLFVVSLSNGAICEIFRR